MPILNICQLIHGRVMGQNGLVPLIADGWTTGVVPLVVVASHPAAPRGRVKEDRVLFVVCSELVSPRLGIAQAD